MNAFFSSLGYELIRAPTYICLYIIDYRMLNEPMIKFPF